MSADFHLYQDSDYLKKLKSYESNLSPEHVGDFVHSQLEDARERVQDLSQSMHLGKRKDFSSQVFEAAFRNRIKKKQRRARVFAFTGLGLWVVAVLVFALGVMPTLVYSLFPESADRIAKAIGETADISKSGFGETIYETEVAPEPLYVPPFDPSLPQENRLIIPSIGVDTDIGEGEDWEKVLETGVWRANEFGEPTLPRLPMVLAAHRFGYLKWTNQYRRENSFYNLPKLEDGDLVEVVWNQRKYIYEVYEGYTDTHLRDFDADLILFTCQVLNSNQRIIRKARLVEPEAFQEYLGEG